MKRIAAAACGVILMLACGSLVLAQSAPDAAVDQPTGVQQQQRAAFEKAIAPYLEQARATYPGARARFLGGLPQGDRFFVVTRIFDASGHWEQVYVRVAAIQNGHVNGMLYSQLKVVAGFRMGQPISVSEENVLDWLIVKRDGSEEGNVVGKFLDTYKP